MPEKPFHHRASHLKQTNKPFKSKHATKGALKDKTKGWLQTIILFLSSKPLIQVNNIANWP